MKQRFWYWLRECLNVPEGIILPWWMQVIYALLFPLKFMHWRVEQKEGYQWRTDTWRIDGVQYSAAGLRGLAEAQGEIYRVTRSGETVTMEALGFLVTSRIPSKPGDVWFIETEKCLSAEQRDNLMASFKKSFPEQKVLLLDGGLRFKGGISSAS
jgi:hypothetical protein